MISQSNLLRVQFSTIKPPIGPQLNLGDSIQISGFHFCPSLFLFFFLPKGSLEGEGGGVPDTMIDKHDIEDSRW